MLNGSNARSEISEKYLNATIEIDQIEKYTSTISGSHSTCSLLADYPVHTGKSP